jgi:hypothetical protein
MRESSDREEVWLKAYFSSNLLCSERFSLSNTTHLDRSFSDSRGFLQI